MNDDVLESLAAFLGGFMPFRMPKEESGKPFVQPVVVAPLPLPVKDVTPSVSPQPATAPGTQTFDWHTGSVQPPPVPTMEPQPLPSQPATAQPSPEPSTAGTAGGAGQESPQTAQDERQAMLMAWQPFEPFLTYQPQPMQDVGAMQGEPGAGFGGQQPSFITSAEPGADFGPGQAPAGKEPGDIGDKLAKLSETMKDLIRVLEDAKRRETVPHVAGPTPEGGFVPMGVQPASHIQDRKSVV